MKIKKSHVNINVGLLVLILSLTVAGTLNQSLTPQYTLETPKSSDGEITIITPENKTYTEPDSGYYPATYGFENDAIGSDPEGWQVDESGGTIQVIDHLDGHQKVVEIYDSSPLARPQGNILILQPFSPISSGVVELWIRTSDSNNYTGITIYDGNEDNAIYFGLLASGNIEYYDGTWNVIRSYSADTWYHMSFEFDTSLNWNVSINGMKYGPFNYRGTPTDMDNILIVGGSIGLNYYFYVDAVGFSWDPNYNIGDNWNEGLLLGYDNTTTLDWQGFSLDGQANRTILGNTTIPMPEDGGHNIQVFGNDTMGTMYESNLRYFTVNTAPPEITINSPTPSQTIGSTAPNYDISITGPYDSIWYTLDGGATNLTANSLTGTINQAAWTALADGIITIMFFANNSAGMEGSAQVMVIKDSSEDSIPPPGIPGYNLYILVGIISLVSIIILKKRYKN